MQLVCGAGAESRGVGNIRATCLWSGAQLAIVYATSEQLVCGAGADSRGVLNIRATSLGSGVERS
ncbi:hypothetical protein KCTCHS21_46980 [Cohnella abietis]|uniref:Uncharacterized protein n=1 Tax=Cohnella abietis TaxID=2507935 RepID=A0A3T1DB47_9BACL|nr:hypothetical protein KCTCHS21_46980 [Cohnella abietis]